MKPAGGVSGLTLVMLLAADPYCTDKPFSEAGVMPRLKISMKSFLNVAPELPPPP